MTSGDAIGSAREDLAGLIDRLRDARFRVGTSEAIDATALLLALQAEADVEAAIDIQRICSRLRPVFCKSADEQRRFDAIFHAWWATRIPAPSTPSPQTPVVIPTPPTVMAAPMPVNWRRWANVAVLVLLASGGYWLFGPQGDQPPQSSVQPAQPTPSVPTPSGSAPSPSIPVAPTPAPADQEFVPLVRRTVEIRPWWVWTLGALPILALLSLSVPILVLSRTRLKRRSEPMFLDPAPLEKDARRLVPALTPEISDRLARHVRSTGMEIERLARRPLLDVRRTLEATVRNRGIPSLRFSVARVHPSYLLLIDAANERDPRGRLFYQWAERLQREGLDVELLLMRRAPGDDGPDAVRVCEPETARRIREPWPRSLRQVRDPVFGERLMVISDGQLFVDGTGTWSQSAALARFHRWRDRAIFTPTEPRDWGNREESLERVERLNDPGFIVLPLEESALSAWTDLVLTGQLSTVTLTDPQRFPALLRKNRQTFVSDDAPPPDQVEKLIAQLRLYLGDRGFYWLAAIAATPVVRWELTLLIGKEALSRLPRLGQERSLNASLARNYRRLVRLPWLQQERMPNWLRLRLLVELSNEEQEQLREVVSALLGRLKPHGVADGIELSFERPPGSTAPPGASRGQSKRSEDPIYLGYMSGLPADQLVLRAPREWTSWASKIPLRRGPGLRGWFSNAGARLRAGWSRWMWAGGMPHLGWNPRRTGMVALLIVPLLVGLAAASRAASASGMRNWFFHEGLHRRSITAPALTSVALNADGRHAATVEDGAIRLWDPVSGKQLGETVRGLGDVRRAIFTRDGSRMVFATAEGKVRVLNLATKEATADMATIVGGADGPMAINGDGSRLLVSNAQGALVLLDTTATPARRLLETKVAPVRAALFVTGSEDLDAAVVLADGTVHAIALAPPKLSIVDGPRLQSHPGLVVAASQVGEDALVVATEPDGSVRVLDDVLKAVGPPLLPPGSKVKELQFSGDGKRVAAATEDGAIHFWALGTKADAERMAQAGTIDDDAHDTLERGYQELVDAAASPANRWLWGLGAFVLLTIAVASSSTRVKRLVVASTLQASSVSASSIAETSPVRSLPLNAIRAIKP